MSSPQLMAPYSGGNCTRRIYEKAAAIGWRIIAGHVFHDGNKPTGMETCRLYLDLNGYDMRIDQDVIDMALKIAKSEIDEDSFAVWIEERTTQRPADDE